MGMNLRFSQVRRETRWIVKESSVYFSIFWLTSTPGFYEKEVHTHVQKKNNTYDVEKCSKRMLWKRCEKSVFPYRPFNLLNHTDKMTVLPSYLIFLKSIPIRVTFFFFSFFYIHFQLLIRVIFLNFLNVYKLYIHNFIINIRIVNIHKRKK